MALGSFRSNPLRTLLTMVGIVIGVAAVLSLLAIGEGANRKIRARLESMGSNLLIVVPDRERRGSNWDVAGRDLTREDAAAIQREVVGIGGVAPKLYAQGRVQAGSAAEQYNIVGTSTAYPRITNHPLMFGRFFTEAEDHNAEAVAVLGTTVYDELFSGTGQAGRLGMLVRINNKPFRVVGVLEPKGGGSWVNRDEMIYIPLNAAQKRLFGDRPLNDLNLEVIERDDMEFVRAQVTRVLRRLHGLAGEAKDDFRIHSQQELIAVVDSILGIMRTFLASIAAISLLVGGVGIMNIMLVAVAERTREIGIKKAIGASRGHIRLQFLIESVALCFCGGALGVGLGMAIARLVGTYGDWDAPITPQHILLAFGFATLVGLFFGYYPAEKAARLNPIDALRYE